MTWNPFVTDAIGLDTAPTRAPPVGYNAPVNVPFPAIASPARPVRRPVTVAAPPTASVVPIEAAAPAVTAPYIVQFPLLSSRRELIVALELPITNPEVPEYIWT